MRNEHFTGILSEGHKEMAIPVPFDPTARWKLPAVRLAPGQHGHRVRGRLNGLLFESAVVARARGFFLIVSEELRMAAGLTAGSAVEVTLHPEPPAAAPAEPPGSRSYPGRRPRAKS
jgi:hypothetical protein